MVVTTRSKRRIFQQEIERLSLIDMASDDTSNLSSNTTTSRSLSTSHTEEQILTTLAKEQIKTLSKFGGAENEDVVIWIQHVEEVFDRAQLQSSNKYLAIQSYLVDAALKWFRFNKSNILDWSSFKTAIVQAYQPTLHQTLVKLEQRYQLPGESVMEYHYDKLHLCLQADPNMSSCMIVHYLTKGLNDYLIPHVIRRHPTTPHDFLVIAQDEEKIFITLKGLSSDSTTDADNYPTEHNYGASTVGVIQRPIHTNRRSSNRQYHQLSPQPLMNIPINPYRQSSTSSSLHYYFQQRPSSLSSRQCYSCYGFGHLAV